MNAILKYGKFLHDGRIYRAGAILPYTDTVKELIAKGQAEIRGDTPKRKPTKKQTSEKSPETTAPTPTQPSENAASNS